MWWDHLIINKNCLSGFQTEIIYSVSFKQCIETNNNVKKMFAENLSAIKWMKIMFYLQFKQNKRLIFFRHPICHDMNDKNGFFFAI